MRHAPHRSESAAELDPARPLTTAAARDHIAATAFRPTAPTRVGAEVESLVAAVDDPHRRPAPDSLRDLLAASDALPRRTRLTFEPGGALELSSPPVATIGECFDAVEPDRVRVQHALSAGGLEFVGLGLDPVRMPGRVLRSDRYQAMEQLFDQDGRAGRWMMANTASVQICLDTGTDDPGATGLGRRWSLAGRLAPLLLAAFANSPVRRGRIGSWRSTRQHVWSAVDRSRSRPASLRDPEDTWPSYVLNARVMAVRGHDRWSVRRGLTFAEWISAGVPRPPTLGDLDYHLTTVFAPVRPRGRYLELRTVDAQAGPEWAVPVAVARALLDDPAAADTATEAVERLWADVERPAELYARAAAAALRDRALARAAVDCFDAALAALERGDADARVTALVRSYAERYVAAGRTPADDRIDRDAASASGR